MVTLEIKVGCHTHQQYFMRNSTKYSQYCNYINKHNYIILNCNVSVIYVLINGWKIEILEYHY